MTYSIVALDQGMAVDLNCGAVGNTMDLGTMNIGKVLHPPPPLTRRPPPRTEVMYQGLSGMDQGNKQQRERGCIISLELCKSQWSLQTRSVSAFRALLWTLRLWQGILMLCITFS
ncbi:hypothetical protein F2P79_015065 [Pimephales promelas]|nr:hypothetical protein F2P79_015065 [Pimephales promelas]